MKLFSGLDYLKISIANHAGKDKLDFEDRISWFDENIQESVVTMSNEELAEYVLTFDEPDSVESLYTGLLAYQDYFYGRESGYIVHLDAVCSGLSLMSCLVVDTNGLTYTGILSNHRADLYSEVFKRFKSHYDKPVEKTRSDVKDAVMTFSYGSSKVPNEIFGESEEMLTAFYTAMEDVCGDAMELREFIFSLWNAKKDYYTWILPDGFTAHNPVMVEKTFEHSTEINGEDFTIPYSLKVLGTKKKSVELAANSVHSCDSMIVREMIRRCQFDMYKVQEVLHFLTMAEHTNPNSKAFLDLSDSKLKDLISYYEESDFCTIRIIEYINNSTDALLLSSKHRQKLISILEPMLKQGNINIVTIHDSFGSNPNNMNYIRYWYKEIIADLVESNTLEFIYSQIAEDEMEEAVSKKYRTKIANQIRLESNYALC